MEKGVPGGFIRAFQILMEAYAEENCNIQLKDVQVIVVDSPETAGRPEKAS